MDLLSKLSVSFLRVVENGSIFSYCCLLVGYSVDLNLFKTVHERMNQIQSNFCYNINLEDSFYVHRLKDVIDDTINLKYNCINYLFKVLSVYFV